MDNVAINTTGSTSAATGFYAYRAQEIRLESSYFLGNQNQTGMTIDGTGNMPVAPSRTWSSLASDRRSMARAI